MKNKTIKLIAYCIGALIAIYVTGLRLFTFIFELGLKTPQTDNLKNLLIFNLPDFISVVFCFTYIIIFLKGIRNAIQHK
jgi:biotin transporter BioY